VSRELDSSSQTKPSLTTLTLVFAAVMVPLAIVLAWPRLPAIGRPPKTTDLASRFPQSPLRFDKQTIGRLPSHPQRITNVQVVDFDEDGRLDVLACDCIRNTVWWYRQTETNQWEERALSAETEFADPAHATVVDLDADGDPDVLVSVLGSVWPTDSRIGRVVLLENSGDFQFESRVLLDDLRRVADVQAGDLDGDGDLDLVVAEFGYDHGRIFWMENRGGSFRDHEILVAPGTVHVPIADYDNDGDLDIAAIVTQEEEEVWIFENSGNGVFAPHRVHFTTNFDLGGSGLVATDLDRDGDQDLLLTAGDNLELVYHYPQPYHGCIWLENLGGLRFEAKRIATFGGTYAAQPTDLDGDGDTDVLLSSMFNDWRQPGTASLVWLENDGKQNFTTWQIDDSPSHLCTVACGDLNQDGLPDIVAGSLHTHEPFGRLGRVTVWFSRKGTSQ